MANRGLEKNILTAVQAILAADAVLSPYVKKVYMGVRDTAGVPQNTFPCIMVDPARVQERTLTTDRHHQVQFSVAIWCWVYDQDYDSELVGRAAPVAVGLLDLVNDVKNALDAFPNLNYDATVKRCDRFLFPDAPFGLEAYPFRYCKIQMDTFYLTQGPTQRINQ